MADQHEPQRGGMALLVGPEETPQHARALLVVHPPDAHAGTAPHRARTRRAQPSRRVPPAGGSSTPSPTSTCGVAATPKRSLTSARSLGCGRRSPGSGRTARRRSAGGGQAPRALPGATRPAQHQGQAAHGRVVQVRVEGETSASLAATASSNAGDRGPCRSTQRSMSSRRGRAGSSAARPTAGGSPRRAPPRSGCGAPSRPWTRPVPSGELVAPRDGVEWHRWSAPRPRGPGPPPDARPACGPRSRRRRGSPCRNGAPRRPASPLPHVRSGRRAAAHVRPGHGADHTGPTADHPRHWITRPPAGPDGRSGPAIG